jgi:hypothetical protein
MYSDQESLSPADWMLLIECDEDLWCDAVTDTCVGPCERGAWCVTDLNCDDTQGLVCVVNRCDTPRAVGAPCQEYPDCEEGLRCAPDPAEPGEWVCLERLANGEACAVGRPEDCVSGFCNPMSSQCEAASSPGELCPSASHTQCDGGYCETDYVFCTGDGECAGSGSCNLVYNRCEYYCVALQPDGAMCSLGRECESDACIDGFCRTVPLADGEPCSSDWHCESGFCNLETERECETLPLPNGRACWLGNQCESGVCHNMECVIGLSEGDACDTPGDPPCARDLFCDWDEDQPLCVHVFEPGAPCERHEQCRGSCVGRFGRLMCDSTPEEETAICDGQ